MKNNLRERVGKLEAAISKLIQNIQEVNSSIAHGFSKVDENFKIINEKIDSIRGGFNASLQTVEGKLTKLTKNFYSLYFLFSFAYNEEFTRRSGSDIYIFRSRSRPRG